MNLEQQRHYNQICAIVQGKGGRILSDRYVNKVTHVLVECQYGHQWMSRPDNIKSGYYCKICMKGSHKAREDFFNIVSLKGGKVIGTYVNVTTHVEVQCGLGHTWMVSPYHVKDGHWCPTCAGQNSFVKEENFLNIVGSKGGKIHSEYKNSKSYINIECENGHMWKVIPNSITVKGTWCPICKQSKGELEVSRVLNSLGIAFIPQYRHPYLTSHSYDFYFTYNGKAYIIEFDGIQHFNEISFFQNHDNFKRRQEYDRLKTFVALTTGYRIIRIDYTKIDQIANYIVHALQNDVTFLVSSPELYSWLLGSTVSIEILHEKCPLLYSQLVPTTCNI